METTAHVIQYVGLNDDNAFSSYHVKSSIPLNEPGYLWRLIGSSREFPNAILWAKVGVFWELLPRRL